MDGSLQVTHTQQLNVKVCTTGDNVALQWKLTNALSSSKFYSHFLFFYAHNRKIGTYGYHG